MKPQHRSAGRVGGGEPSGIIYSRSRHEESEERSSSSSSAAPAAPTLTYQSDALCIWCLGSVTSAAAQQRRCQCLESSTGDLASDPEPEGKHNL